MSDSEIIEALATKVMGWVREPGPDGDWYDDAEAVGCDSPNEYYDWNPLIDAADSKQVREKLAERYTVWELGKSSAPRIFTFYVDGGADDGHYAEADTEERAVALCALKSVGINVE